MTILSVSELAAFVERTIRRCPKPVSHKFLCLGLVSFLASGLFAFQSSAATPSPETVPSSESNISSVENPNSALENATDKKDLQSEPEVLPITVPNYKKFTYVDSIDLEIGYTRSDTNWCAERLNLVFVTTQTINFQDPKFLNEQVSTLLSKLNESCAILKEASLTGYSRSEQTKPILTGSALAQNGWKYNELILPGTITANNQSTSAQRAETKSSGDAQGVNPAGSNPSSPEQNRPLTPNEIAELQQRLNFLGFNSGQVDGVANSQTATAAYNFLQQNKINLPVQADLNLLNAVRNLSGQGERSLDRLQPSYSVQQGQRLPQAANQQQVPFSPQNYANTANAQQLNLSRNLSYRLVSFNNRLVDDPAIVLRWLQEEAQDRYSPIRAQAVGLLTTHKSGSQFDKQDVIKQFRSIILQEANSRRAQFQRPLNLVHYFNVSFERNPYKPGVGFPMAITSSLRGYRLTFPDNYNKQQSPRLTRFQLERLRINVAFQISTPQKNDLIPIVDEGNARTFATLLEDRSKLFRTRLYFDLYQDVRIEKDRSNNQTAVFGVKERRYDIIMNDRQNLSGGDQFIYQWNLRRGQNVNNTISQINNSNPQSNQGVTAGQFAKFARIRMVQDHLVYGSIFPNENNDGSNSKFNIDFRTTQNTRNSNSEFFSTGWALFKSLSALKRNPNLTSDPVNAIRVADVFLSDVEKRQFTEGKDFLEFNSFDKRTRKYRGRHSEFELNSFINKVTQTRVGEVYRQFVPRMPLPVVRIFEIQLGQYDFNNKYFPIWIRDSRRNQFRPVSGNETPSFRMEELSNFTVKRFPERLLLPQDRAEFLSTKIGQRTYNWLNNGRPAESSSSSRGQSVRVPERQLFFAVFADIVETGNQDGTAGQQYQVVAKRAAIYLDPNLTQEVAAYSLEYLSQPSKNQQGLRNGSAASITPLALARHPITEIKHPVQVGLGILNDDNLLQQLVLNSPVYKNTNELDQQRVGESLYKNLTSGTQVKPPFVASGTIELGEYDRQSQTFAVKNISDLTFLESEDFPFNVSLSAKLGNRGSITTIPANELVARRVFELTPDKRKRRYRFNAHVTPSLAELADRQNRSNYFQINMLFRAENIVVFKDNSSRGVELISARLIEDQTALQNSSVSNQTNGSNNIQAGQLSDATTSILFNAGLKSHNKNISNETLDWLIANQWLNENFYPGPVSSRFFSAGAQITLRTEIENLRSSYLEFIQNSTTPLPTRLRIPMILDGNGSNNFSALGCTVPTYGISNSIQRLKFKTRGVNSGHYQYHVDQANRQRERDYVVLKKVPLFYQVNSPLECNNRASRDLKNILDPQRRNRIDRNATVQIILDQLPFAQREDNQFRFPGSFGNFAFIDVSIEDIEVAEDRNGVPSLLVSAKFNSIEYQRLETINGKLSTTPTRTIPVEEFADEVDANSVKLSKLDILGIKLGMDVDEAEAILSKHFDDAVIVSSVVDLSPATPAFSQLKLFTDKSGREIVRLYTEYSDDNKIVRGIFRSLSAGPNTTFASKDILKAARAKFGEADFTNLTPNNSELAWGDAVNDTWCRISLGGNLTNVWKRGDVTISDLYNYPDLKNALNQGNFQRSLELKNSYQLTQQNGNLEQFMRPYEPCGTTAQLSWNNKTVETKLVDWQSYINSYLGTLEKIQKEINEQPVGEASDSNIKL